MPPTGFDLSEAYIESSSVQCETRVCMVYHLDGVPKDTGLPCVDNPTTCAQNDKTCVPAVKCAKAEDVDQRVYCTCRCNSGNSKFASCSCPSGYKCTPVLEQGSVGVVGSYCVLNATANAEGT